MHRGAWRAAVHGAAESDTPEGLSRLTDAQEFGSRETACAPWWECGWYQGPGR